MKQIISTAHCLHTRSFFTASIRVQSGEAFSLVVLPRGDSRTHHPSIACLPYKALPFQHLGHLMTAFRCGMNHFCPGSLG